MDQPFTEIAPIYDRLNGVLSFGIQRRWKRHLVARLAALSPHPSTPRILDVATGTGELGELLMQEIPGAVVTGADPCEAMLEAGRERRSLSQWVRASSEELPFAASSFDAITCSFGVRNFDRLDRALSEWHRVLRNGGLAAIIEIHPIPDSWFAPLLRFYWRRVMPLIGRISGKPGAYEYLRASSAAFLSAEAMARAVERAGFRRLALQSLWGHGMVSFSIYQRDESEA